MHARSYLNMNDISDRILEVCVLEYNDDLLVHRVCGPHCGVCFMLVWEYIYISLARLSNALCVHGEYLMYTIDMCLDFSI